MFCSVSHEFNVGRSGVHDVEKNGRLTVVTNENIQRTEEPLGVCRHLTIFKLHAQKYSELLFHVHKE